MAVNMCKGTLRNGGNEDHDRRKKHNVSVVLGAQWGDEGKGKIVDFMCQNADIACRCQGGNNAGHTVVTENQKYDFHLLPSGIINPNCVNIIGNGVVLHVTSLFEELQKNVDKGLTGWEDRLIISSRAHLVFDFHQAADGLEESGRGQKLIGTTKKGIGPTYSCKAARNGIRVADLVYDFDVFTEKFKNLADVYMHRYPGLKIDVESELAKYKELRERVRPLMRDTVTYLHNVLQSSAVKTIIIEGANATMLDIDFGTYPMVTSSNCSIGGVFTGLGIPPSVVRDIYGVVKAYLTRVGSGCFPTEMEPKLNTHVRERGSEYGVTTGRPRRCGWLDMVMLRYVNMINGFTGIALTKLDILDDQPEIKIGVAYVDKTTGEKLEEFPACEEEFSQITVEYLTMPGWECSTEHARTFDELPPNAQAYVRKIEELMEVPVKWIGVGSQRDAVICL
jgi:adenylosuccinate synthase